MSDLGQFFKSVPPVTRTITLTSLVMAGLNSLKIIPIGEFTCEFPIIFHKFEIHRLLTGFLIPNPQAMQGMMEIYMLYSFSKGIEEGKFKKNLPDYIYYFMIVLPTILVGTFLFVPPMYSLHPALLSALTFTWSVHNYSQQVNFYFMPIQASLLPGVSLGFRLLVDGFESFLLSLIGCAGAYAYNCLETKSSGPLQSLLTGHEPELDPNHNRLGTINSNVKPWFYSTGLLNAPQWLKGFISRLTGVDYDSPAYRRGFVGTGLRKNSTNSGTSGSKLGGIKLGGGGVFRGSGRRLGSTKDD